MNSSLIPLALAILLILPGCSGEQRVSAIREKATHGDARAQGLMGEMYANGDDVQKNYGEAARWWRTSAEGGLAQAQYNLGVLYERGQGVPRSDAQAAEWYGRAARQGLAAAEFNLGVLYEHGRGVPANPAEAAAWYKKAGDQGHADAQFNLGAIYARQQRPADAYFWLSLVAKTGDHDAERLRDQMAARLPAAQADEIRHRADNWRATVSG